jgi:hypothetical protein
VILSQVNLGQGKQSFLGYEPNWQKSRRVCRDLSTKPDGRTR